MAVSSGIRWRCKGPAREATFPRELTPGKLALRMNVTIIGHGSLMSGRGLSFSGVLQVRQAEIVALANCRRGFAKLSRYGDRFATDLAPTRFPLMGRRVTRGSSITSEVEGLALTVPLADACRLAKREGYNPEAFQRLAECADARGSELAAFLWRIHEEAAHDVVGYRRQLFSLTSYTSPHYIPHPVSLGNAAYALIFLAPGFEGTGADDVVAIRQQTNIPTIMNLAEAWRRKPNDDQIAYFLSCLLGGVHGVNVRDLLFTDQEESMLSEKIKDRLGEVLDREQELFLTATSLTLPDYQRTFGEKDAALKRSGLQDFLNGARP